MQVSDSSSDAEEDQNNIELCATSTKSWSAEEIGPSEIVDGINEENAVHDVQSIEKNSPNINAELSQLATPKLKVSVKKRTLGSKSKENDNRAQEVFEMMKSVNESRKKREEKPIDDFDVFGDLVARKLRGLRTRYAQCTIQHLINNLLYDGELGKYDIPPQTYDARSNYNNYSNASSSASIISYSNPPSIQNVTEPTPEVWGIGENENVLI